MRRVGGELARLRLGMQSDLFTAGDSTAGARLCENNGALP